ncbi:MAG TPA: DUF2235 domain-containing protein [Methylophilaceae bacterium]|nr:DUF2235 domain-containing protein [Methylophilaceae bacterium]
MKRIVIFADGTWNSPEDGLETNVLQLAEAVAPSAGNTKQVTFYDWGVGADTQKLMGGISGAGIDKNIMDCYRFIVHNYEPGDQLFFFGFSRGAYTVRSLAGFIRNAGVLKREFANRESEAFLMYRNRSLKSHPNDPASVAFRKQYAVADTTDIEFVGVWDTVGALGIPVPFWGTLGKREFLFHDTQPSKIIKHARHALSIDENRVDFEPTLWDASPDADIQQVWFAGVHADIGGGYAESGLSYCAANWIISEASQFGLVFENYLLKKIKPNPLDKQHNERKGVYLMRDESVRNVVGSIHASVKKRWEQDVDAYQKKSKALIKLLSSVNDDWSKLHIVD